MEVFAKNKAQKNLIFQQKSFSSKLFLRAEKISWNYSGQHLSCVLTNFFCFSVAEWIKKIQNRVLLKKLGVLMFSGGIITRHAPKIRPI